MSDANLREDAERFEWVLPIVGGDTGPEPDRRAMALGLALLSGLSGRAAIDKARGVQDNEQAK